MPGYVQHASGNLNSSAGPLTLSLSGVATDALLYVLIAKTTGTPRTFAVSSDIDGAYASIAVTTGSDRKVEIFALDASVTAGSLPGNHTFTITPSATVTCRVDVVEIEGALGAAHLTDVYNDVTAANTHYCSASGLTESGACTVLSTGCSTGSSFNAGPAYAGPTYTALSATASHLAQYMDAPTGVTSERAEWGHAGAARICIGVMVVVPHGSAPPPITLDGALAAAATVTGALTTAIRAATGVSGSAAVTGALTTAIRPAASVTAAATTSAALTSAIRAAASVTGSAATSAALTTAIRAAASVTASAMVTADLSAGVGLAVSVTGTATTTAALSTAIRAAAAVTATATVSADLLAGSGLAAAPTATATTTAALTTAIRAAGAATATATVTAALSTSVTCAGAVSGTVTVSGALDTSTGLAATLATSTLATGTLTTQIALAAIVATQATAVAALTAPSSNVPDVIVMGAITASTLAVVGPITVSEAIVLGTITQVGEP